MGAEKQEERKAIAVERGSTVADRKHSFSLTALRVRFFFFLASIAIFIGAWEIAAAIVNARIILADPYSVLFALSGLLQNHIPVAAAGIGNIYQAILLTIEIVVVGFVLSLVGIPVGFLMGRWKAAEAIIDPWINALYAIPMVALIPVMYFGLANSLGGTFVGDVFIAFLMAVFTVTINTYHGVKYISNSLAEVGKAYGASEAQFTRHIIFPASLPDIVSGMRLGLGRAVLGAVIAEALFSVNGLGYSMLTFQETLDTPDMIAIISLIALIGIVALQTPKFIERRLFKWKESERLSRGL